MPDGLVSYNLAPVDQHKVKNKLKSDQRTDMMGGGKLETLVEHSSLEADDLSSSFSGGLGRIGDQKMNLTVSTSEDDELIFPSADGQSPVTTKKSSSAIALDFNSDFGGLFSSSFTNGTANNSVSLSKLHQPSSNGSAGGGSSRNMPTSLMDFDPIFPKDHTKQRRQQARDIAIAEQKALLLEKERQENLWKLKQAQERQDKIANEYASFMTGGANKKPSPSGGGGGGSVLRQIGKFEAVAELNEEKKSQELIASPTRSPRYGHGLVSPHHSYSGRPRKPSNDSLDPKPIEDQVTIL